MFQTCDPETSRQLLPGIRMQPLAYGERTSMTKFFLASGAALPRHDHPHEQTGYLVSGRVIFDVAGERHEVTAGDSWSIPAGVPHSAEVVEDAVIIEVFAPVREEYLPT